MFFGCVVISLNCLLVVDLLRFRCRVFNSVFLCCCIDIDKQQAMLSLCSGFGFNRLAVLLLDIYICSVVLTFVQVPIFTTQRLGLTSQRFIKVLWTFYMLRLVGKPSTQHFISNSLQD